MASKVCRTLAQYRYVDARTCRAVMMLEKDCLVMEKPGLQEAIPYVRSDWVPFSANALRPPHVTSPARRSSFSCSRMADTLCKPRGCCEQR